MIHSVGQAYTFDCNTMTMMMTMMEIIIFDNKPAQIATIVSVNCWHLVNANCNKSTPRNHVFHCDETALTVTVGGRSLNIVLG